jgi:hypothetical protein
MAIIDEMKGRNIKRDSLSRRDLLKQIASVGVYASFPGLTYLSGQRSARKQNSRSAPTSIKAPLSASDDTFLEELEKANFQFFWRQAHPETGMVLDRCNARTLVTGGLGSIAATGFGLTALCIGEKRGYVLRREAQERALNTLRFLWKKLPNHRGFFYHWANITTGERIWDSEVSSVDTAILLCGVLTCRQHFIHSEINDLAHEIFNRVDWNWLSEDTPILPHGWTPENGFLQYRWGDYIEMMMMYLLGLGSPAHPMPAETWNAWKRTTF